MIIVKMNNTTVECNIAASELREIGLTPESLVNGEQRSERLTSTATNKAPRHVNLGACSLFSHMPCHASGT